ncbi:MAG TPA: LuxR C-terminal-related transcriptional regulator [Anaerolineales bacterium]|nr:LuxR C-terminal-related transcriptional regulator [Anaerolineales bacterium]
MTTPVLTAKLYIPPSRPRMVLRPRLIKRLNEGLRQSQGFGRKLTLISAPAGFGKTTLVREWVVGWHVDDPDVVVAWLSLDEGDNDSSRFLIYLVAALQTVFPNIGSGVLGVLQSPHPPPLKSILTDLLNEITATPANFILVLDDYHVIDTKAGDALRSIDEALAFLLEHMPPQIHLVIATREDPNLPLARLRARGHLVELRVSDLRFTPSEAAEFINQVMGLNIAAADAQALQVRTEGWVAGLQLAALALREHPDVTGFIQSFTGSHHFVLDYLMEEVLHKQPETIQTFLLQTSILERMCGQLCDEVRPDSSATGQETLEQLERANLFVIPLDNERRWYRYHHLFRDLLRRQLMQTVSPQEIARVHIHASVWWEANGDIAEAFHHALAAADVDRAARLAESAWQGMDESFQTGAWLGWVNQLPSSVIRVRPVLCTQIGLAHKDAGNIEASESSLRDAEQGLNLLPGEMDGVQKGQLQMLPAWIAFARAYNAQSQHRFSDAVKYAETALDLTPSEDVFMVVQVSMISFGAHWANGDLDVACKLVNDFIEASKQAGKFLFAVAGAFGKADILTAQGRLRDVLQTYQQALELAAAHNLEQHTAHHHLGLGTLYYEMGQDERAARHWQKSFELGEQTTIEDWAYRKSLAQAHLKESAGDLDGALHHLHEAQRLYVRTPSPNLRPADAMAARIYLKQGQLLKAQEWGYKSKLSLRDAPDYLHEFEYLTLTRIALAEYQYAHDEQLCLDILGLLERQLKLAEKQNRFRSRIEILIVQALAFYAKGEVVKALAALEKALTLAEPEGYVRIFAAEGKPMAELLSHLDSGHLMEYAEKIVTVFTQPQKPQASPLISHPLFEPLTEREHEVLRLLAQGLSNQQLAQKLFVALSTVKGHNLRIFAKLQAKSRTEAVARARELGLL